MTRPIIISRPGRMKTVATHSEVPRHHNTSPLDVVFIHGLCGNDGDSWSWADQPRQTIQAIAPPGARLSRGQGVFDLDLSSRPGLGGILLKQTLWKARQQPHRLHGFIVSISGIVFLATPHIVTANTQAIHCISQILKADLKTVSSRTVSRKGVSHLAFAGMRFDELGLQIPILSCFETHETRLRSTIFFTKREILVPHSLARTNANLERLVELDSDLNSIFGGHDESLIHRQMADFIFQVMQKAPENIENEFGTRIIAGIPVSTIQSKLSIPSSLAISERRVSDQTITMAASPSSSYRTDMSYEMIQSSTTSTSLASVHFPCFGKLPSRNPNFCGRQEIMVAIDETLLPTADSQQNNNLNRLRTHSIHGLGGMGKTQIATEYAQSRKNCFDAVFWINAASSEKLDVSFCQIASTLDLLENANSQDPVVCRALVKGWLVDPVKTLRSRHDLSNTESRGNANWLLIFDNADKPDILRDYWPQDGQGSILVTSRDPVVSTGTYFGGSSTLLETFTVPEAVDLLSKLVPRNTAATSSQESYNVVTRLGCYPLAISSMAGVICRQSLTLQEFIHLYSKELLLGELHNVTYGISSGYDHNIGSTWALENLQLSAGALLNVISLLDPDGIPEGILMQNPEVAVDIGFPQLPQTYFKQLVELTQSSVVERNSDTKELKMHRMVQEVARVKMTRTQNMLEQTFDAAVKLTSSVWPYVTVVAQHGYANYTRIDRWDQCSKMLPHILSLKYVFTTYDLVSSSKITCLRELLVLFSEVAW
ncbi:hypothetical protein WAI453_010891 [Rhynchosporium graminicola]